MDWKAMAHAGMISAVYPFRVVRLFQSGTFMFACISGSGEVMVDGCWLRVSANEACLLPPFKANAIQAIRGQPEWKFCWVHYLKTPRTKPLIFSKSPVKGSFDAAAFSHAVEGLCVESSKREPSVSQSHLWIELIHGYVTAFAQPAQNDSRLWRLWKQVEADPGQNWSIPAMAAIAAMSEEHLRRLCMKELGCSPGKCVTSLRIQRACHLLSTTDEKISSIATAVGYESPFTFATTFRKWTGLQPSAHRNLRKTWADGEYTDLREEK
jgi:AraC-like DNA-binding protein